MKPGTQFSGGVMRRPRAARPHHRIQAPPGTEFSGGVMRRPRPARKAGHPKKARKIRGLSLGDVQCCAAEALAASLRLAGGAVSDSDVLALFWLAGGDADAGVSILAALEAASEFGLAGRKLTDFKEVMPHEALPLQRRETRAGLITGADLPGPHALYDDGEAWWSWGEPFDPDAFPHAVIEEAWEVRWTA